MQNTALRRLATPALALPALATLAAAALLWLVRGGPLPAAPALAADALGAFFALAVFGGLALAAAARPAGAPTPWPALAAALALAAGFLTSITPLVVAALLPLALLPLAEGGARPRAHLAKGPIAAALLALGYGALALRGGLRYDDRAAGAALDGFAFWFVLLAAAVPLLPLAGRAAHARDDAFLPLQVAWLYPLARLYSLGPWNEGWSFATILLGGAAALWCAGGALGEPRPARRRELGLQSQLALALAGVGLSTGAGLAAGCYGILTYLVLAAAHIGETPHTPAADHPTPGAGALRTLAGWLLTPALPFGAPFVAAWMMLGAGVAGGVALLGAAAWLVALLGAAAHALGGSSSGAGRTPAVAAGASAALGVLAPAAVLLLVQPVIEQLQGGLSVHGDVNVWPWVGLAAVDSTRRGVTALPSVAIAALMLVLVAAAYLLAQIRGEREVEGAVTPGDAPARALGAELRALVPWLGAPAHPEERAGDDR